MRPWRLGGRRRKKLVQELIAGRMSKAEAAEGLGVTRRTLNRYLRRFLESGPAGLADRRRSNYRKVDPTIETAVVQAKQDGPHRSARFLRDHLGLPPSADTVRRILVKHHLERTSLPPLKPIRRFEAPEPNALWQIDIQGQVRFPLLGDLLLVGVKDDHSRFLLAGRWFFHQYKINIFMVLHEAFRHWGLPQALLSERGPQGWAHPLHAETEYQAPGSGASASSRATAGGPGPKGSWRTPSASPSGTSSGSISTWQPSRR
ncbi:MAG TPA: helix-turn-helix domain-containing protein [Candidatus Acidoferrum sp.]|nr:helix-turn-helix domain-containing protein [Candidatus Acidoferrum sp.]